MGSTPTLVTDDMIPWSNGEDAWPTSRKVQVRFLPGSLTTGLQVLWPHAAVVRRKTGFNPRTDLSNIWACMPMGATDPCKIGVIGSTPIRSTEQRADRQTGRHRPGVAEIRVRIPVGPLTSGRYPNWLRNLVANQLPRLRGWTGFDSPTFR